MLNSLKPRFQWSRDQKNQVIFKRFLQGTVSNKLYPLPVDLNEI